jgi:hypothetical protein
LYEKLDGWLEAKAKAQAKKEKRLRKVEKEEGKLREKMAAIKAKSEKGKEKEKEKGGKGGKGGKGKGGSSASEKEKQALTETTTLLAAVMMKKNKLLISSSLSKPKKHPLICPLLHLESLSLECVNAASGHYLLMSRWLKALHELNQHTLKEICLVGMEGTTWLNDLSTMINTHKFPHLESLHIDTFTQTDALAATLVEACAVGCKALLNLNLGNSAGNRRHSWQHPQGQGTGSSGALMVGKLIECARGSGGTVVGRGLLSLETLSLTWEGFTQKEKLTTFLFGRQLRVVGEGGAAAAVGGAFLTALMSTFGGGNTQTGNQADRQSLPFPNLYAFGLQGMRGKVTAPFLTEVLKACVARNVLQVDFRFNDLNREATRAIVDAAKVLAPTLCRGETLHLHMAQFRKQRPHESWDQRYYVLYRFNYQLLQHYNNLPRNLKVYVEKG